jgi:hypothetical protein
MGVVEEFVVGRMSGRMRLSVYCFLFVEEPACYRTRIRIECRYATRGPNSRAFAARPAGCGPRQTQRQPH